MDSKETIAWEANAHVYNALSEFYLYQDLYSLSSLMHSILDSKYSSFAKNIIEYIHLDDKKLQTDGEMKIIKDEISFNERDYKNIDEKQLLMFYENSGYELDNFEPDHLAIELKFLALLSIETIESENLKLSIPKELRFINAHLGWLDSLIQKLEEDKRDLRLTKEVVKLTKEYLENHKAFLESYLI